MNNLTIVNKFCANNNFVPTELYTTGKYTKTVVAVFDKSQKEEYDRFVKKANSPYTKCFEKNNIDISMSSNWDSSNNRVFFDRIR
jgi:hypothetical protein